MVRSSGSSAELSVSVSGDAAAAGDGAGVEPLERPKRVRVDYDALLSEKSRELREIERGLREVWLLGYTEARALVDLSEQRTRAVRDQMSRLRSRKRQRERVQAARAEAEFGTVVRTVDLGAVL